MELRDRLQALLGSAYSIQEELGGGGMSRVFVAEERALGRRVVVKVLHPELRGEVNIDRFRRARVKRGIWPAGRRAGAQGTDQEKGRPAHFGWL